MPLDGKVTDFIAPAKIEPLSDDPAIAVRQAIALLRGPLPNGFKWHYPDTFKQTDCETKGCAVGWFHMVWPKQIAANVRRAGEYFGMSESEASKVFISAASVHREILMWEVTPAMVADDLEAWADKKYGKPTDVN